MSRQVRMALLTCVGLGISAPVQAGGTPSAFDSVFAPVSYQAQYTQYSSDYTPYSTSYTPYYAGYSGFFGIPYATSYGPSAGCGCQQTSYASSSYSGGCSSCGGSYVSGNCASGNCASGNCSTTTNLAPSNGLAPMADPTNQSSTYTRNLENRLRHIERYLEENQNFRPSPPEDKFQRSPSNRGFDDREPVQTRPLRPRNGIGEQETYQTPLNKGSGAEPFNERSKERSDVEANKPNLDKQEGASGKNPGASLKGPAPISPPNDKGTMRDLDIRVTSHAVSPRERLSASRTSTKMAASQKSPSVKLEVDAGPRSIDLARH